MFSFIFLLLALFDIVINLRFLIYKGTLGYNKEHMDMELTQRFHKNLLDMSYEKRYILCSCNTKAT